jgi:hypothetical protein
MLLELISRTHCCDFKTLFFQIVNVLPMDLLELIVNKWVEDVSVNQELLGINVTFVQMGQKSVQKDAMDVRFYYKYRPRPCHLKSCRLKRQSLGSYSPWERQPLGSGSPLGAQAPWKRKPIGSESPLGAKAPWDRQRLGSGSALGAEAPLDRQRLGSGSPFGAAAPWERQCLGSGSALGAEAPWERKRLGSGSALGAEAP